MSSQSKIIVVSVQNREIYIEREERDSGLVFMNSIRDLNLTSTWRSEIKCVTHLVVKLQKTLQTEEEEG